MPAQPGRAVAEDARLIARAGELLFGPYWAAPLARALGVEVKILLKVKAAARFGETFPVGPGVMLALRDLVRHRLLALRNLERQL